MLRRNTHEYTNNTDHHTSTLKRHHHINMNDRAKNDTAVSKLLELRRSFPSPYGSDRVYEHMAAIGHHKRPRLPPLPISTTSIISDNSGGVDDIDVVLQYDLKDVDPDANSVVLLVKQWLRQYARDRDAFESKILFCELKLTELLKITDTLKRPNAFRTWICCDLLLMLLDGFADPHTIKVVMGIFHEVLHGVYTNERSDTGLTPYSLKARALQAHLDALMQDYSNTHDRYTTVHKIWSRVLSRWYRALSNTLRHWTLPLKTTLFVYWRRWAQMKRRRRGATQSLLPRSFMTRIERYRRHYDIRTVANYYFSKWREITLRSRVTDVSGKHTEVATGINELTVDNKRFRRLKFSLKDEAIQLTQQLNAVTREERRLRNDLLRCCRVRELMSREEKLSILVGKSFHHVYSVSTQLYRRLCQQLRARDIENPGNISMEFLEKTLDGRHDGLPLLEWYKYHSMRCEPLAAVVYIQQQSLADRKDAMATLSDDNHYDRVLKEAVTTIFASSRECVNDIPEDFSVNDADLDVEDRDMTICRLATLFPAIASNHDDITQLLSELEYRNEYMMKCKDYNDLQEQVNAIEQMAIAVNSQHSDGAERRLKWNELIDDVDMEVCSRALGRIQKGTSVTHGWSNQREFRAKPYTVLSKKLRDLIVKIMENRKTTADMAGFNEELAQCERTLGNCLHDLKGLFQAWSDYVPVRVDGDGSIVEKDYLLSQFKFWRLIRHLRVPSNYCSPSNIENLFASHIRKRRVQATLKTGLIFKHFLSILVSIAYAKFPQISSLSQRISKLMSKYVLSNTATAPATLAFHRDMCTSECERQICIHERYLNTVFRAYSVSSTKDKRQLSPDFTFLTVTDFYLFVNDIVFPSKQMFNHRTVRDIFSAVQMDDDIEKPAEAEPQKQRYMTAPTSGSGEDEMIFHEFIEGVACLARYAYKNMYTPLAVKIDMFVKNALRNSPLVEQRRKEFLTYSKRLLS